MSILRKFAENKPDNLRKLMGRGGWRWVGDFFTKMDEGGEKEKKKRGVTVVTVVTVFRGGGI